MAKTKAQLVKELKELRKRLDRAEKAQAELSEKEESLKESEALSRTLIQHLPQKIFMKDRDSIYVTCNEKFAEDLGIKQGEFKGRNDYDFFPKELADKYRADDHRIMEAGVTEELEEAYVQDGQEFIVNTIKTPVRDDAGNVIGILGIFWDITEKKRMQEALERQAKEILEISTPVVQIWEGVVAAPLIGTLDSERTRNFMERLLNAIVDTGSSVALVDITGVPTIDTQTAQHILEAMAAVRLLGSDVILTGVRPAIAQTLVHLGVDMRGMVTRPSMAAGLKVALDMLDSKSSDSG